MIKYALYILENDLFGKVWPRIGFSFLKMAVLQKAKRHCALRKSAIYFLMLLLQVTNLHQNRTERQQSINNANGNSFEMDKKYAFPINPQRKLPLNFF